MTRVTLSLPDELHRALKEAAATRGRTLGELVAESVVAYGIKPREEAERRRQWEAAMEHAKIRLIEDHRREVLRRRVTAWNEATAIRAYCDAVEDRHGIDTIAADPDAAAWLAFAREQADSAQRLPRMPADPDVTPEALKPYLGKWSPYGPRGW